MLETIYLMPNNTTPTATMMIIVEEIGTTENYQFVYVGDINNLPSDILTESDIINDLSTGGSDKVLSAEMGKELNNDVLSINEEIEVAEKISYTPTSIEGLQVSTPKIINNTAQTLFYVPIRNGQTINVNYSFSSGYCTYGLTKVIPSTNVEVSQYSSGSSSSTSKSLTALEDGYFCISFLTTAINSIEFYSAPNKIGKDVYDIKNEIKYKDYQYKTDLGRGSIEITPTFDILPSSFYRITIDNFIQGHDSSSWTILNFGTKAGSDSEVIVNSNSFKYTGSSLTPKTFYIPTGNADTQLIIHMRVKSGVSVGITLERVGANDVFAFNSRDEIVSRLYNASKYIPSGVKKPFRLLHFSDIHAETDNLKRIVKFSDDMAPYLDCVIHTGDSVATRADATSFDFWDECGAQSILNAIGNHDIWYASGFTPSSNYAYTTYIKPYITTWDIEQPEDAETNNLCYYYKDYVDRGIRLIVLDYSDSSQDQLTWLAGVLADAITEQLAVVIAVHYTPNIDTGFNTSFNTLNILPDLMSGLSATFINAVDTFKGNDGEFVCWLVGHNHRDICGTVDGTNGKQVVICIDSAAMQDSGNYIRYRHYGTKSQDAFNIVTVDTYRKFITVFRVGCDIDITQRKKTSMMIDYENGVLWS